MQWLLQPLGNIYCAAFPNAEIVEVGFEPTKLTQQILSLPPLTTRELNCIHFFHEVMKSGAKPFFCKEGSGN